MFECSFGMMTSYRQTHLRTDTIINTIVQDRLSHLGKLSSSQPVLLSPPPLEGEPVSLPLKHDWSHQPLDLGGLVFLLLALLQGKGPLDHVLADVVLLAQVKKLPDLAGTLGSKSPRDGVVSESRDLSLSLLDNGQVEDGEVTINNAAADGLTLTFSLI